MPTSALYNRYCLMWFFHQADRDLEIKRSENDPLFQGTDLTFPYRDFSKYGC